MSAWPGRFAVEGDTTGNGSTAPPGSKRTRKTCCTVERQAVWLESQTRFKREMRSGFLRGRKQPAWGKRFQVWTRRNFQGGAHSPWADGGGTGRQGHPLLPSRRRKGGCPHPAQGGLSQARSSGRDTETGAEKPFPKPFPNEKPLTISRKGLISFGVPKGI